MDDARVIDDERVPRREQRRQIEDGAVGEFAIRRNDEQPRAIARARGPKRDRLLRQLEIEEIDAHECEAEPWCSNSFSHSWEKVAPP